MTIFRWHGVRCVRWCAPQKKKREEKSFALINPLKAYNFLFFCCTLKRHTYWKEEVIEDTPKTDNKVVARAGESELWKSGSAISWFGSSVAGPKTLYLTSCLTLLAHLYEENTKKKRTTHITHTHWITGREQEYLEDKLERNKIYTLFIYFYWLFFTLLFYEEKPKKTKKLKVLSCKLKKNVIYIYLWEFVMQKVRQNDETYGWMVLAGAATFNPTTWSTRWFGLWTSRRPWKKICN